MRCAVLVLSVFLGCSSIFYDDVPEGYLCREDSAEACPSGQVCDTVKGCCRKPGSSCVGPDLATAGTADLAVPDQAEPSGCVGKGVRISDGLYGCEGPFSRGQAPLLCAPGYAVADSNLNATEFAECGKFNHFFLSKSLIYHSGLMVTTPVQCNGTFADTLRCTPPASLTFRFRLGCGGFRFNGYLECFKSCGALYQVVSCYPPTPIDCYKTEIPGTLEDTNTNPNIGVLCRRK